MATTRTAQRVVTNFKVDLVINTSNERRRIVFGLEKELDDDGLPTWTIHFKLFDRASKSEAYGDPRISLDVVVDKELNDAAESTAADGLSDGQIEHLSTKAAKAAIKSQEPGGKPAKAASEVQKALVA